MCWYWFWRMCWVSTLERSSPSSYLSRPWQKTWRHSLKSFIEKTIPGPLARVSTSVHLLRSFVRKDCTKVSLLTTSKWLLLSTDEKRVEANYCCGWTWAWTWTAAPYSKAARREPCSLSIMSRLIFIISMSRTLLVTLISALTWLSFITIECSLVFGLILSRIVCFS